MVTQTTEYALRAMAYLTGVTGASCTSREIAAATGVPQSYLSKIMRSLVRAGLVRSCRGKHGGFRLARDPVVISVLDIASAIDPVGRQAHTRSYPCLDDARRLVEQALGLTTLAAVVGTASDGRAGPRRTA